MTTTLYILIMLMILSTSLGCTLIIAEMDDIYEELRKMNEDKE